MKRNSLLGRSAKDFIFGESDGGAYEKQVELDGDDLGSFFRAPSVTNTIARVTAPPPPPTPTYAPPAPAFTPPNPAYLSQFTSNMPTLPSAYLAPIRQIERPQVSQQLAQLAQQQAQSQEQPRRRRHRHHHQDEGQGQGQGQYGRPYPYGQPAPQQSLVNTTWPPPAPVNLLPGAPWPPPGAAPGSDLSSFYPVGTPQASSTYWGATQVQVQTPQPAPVAAPMDVYIDNPSYATLGLEYDSQGRASIVDLPRRSAEVQKQRGRGRTMSGAEMGAADHKFDVIALRAKLRRIGMDIPKNGSVDQPLADAVNSVFKGWDDAPKGLRAGDMTPGGLKTHIKLVNRLVDQAVGGAQHLEHAEQDDDSGFSFSHLVHEAEGAVKKIGKTGLDVAAKAARTGGNVVVFITDKSGTITKRIIPGKWANKYINEVTGTINKGARGASHFVSNVLQHPGSIEHIAIHPISTTSNILSATDRWANKGDDVGSFLNPFSWFSSAPKASAQDEEALKLAKKNAKEAVRKAKEAEVQVDLDKDADALERKATAAKIRAQKHKADESGIGLSFDSMGKATIVDMPGRRWE